MSDGSRARLSDYRLSTDHGAILSSLAKQSAPTLIIQDLDGVCMGLVRDPLTRTLEPAYIRAAHRLGDRFRVLTNGEFIGARGVNAIVDRALGDAANASIQGLYLPGLAAGGIQMQDRFGTVRHPGLSQAETRFLLSVPDMARQFLREWLGRRCSTLLPAQVDALISSAVLDNAVSPTLNLNPLFPLLRSESQLYQELQQEADYFLGHCMAEASHLGLADSFFVHLAPNLGRDRDGRERLRTAEGDDAGTTDFQFMVRGAIKEAGVLVILNQYYHTLTGRAPLGEDFHVRHAPKSVDAQAEWVLSKFDPAFMPRLIGVGDTVTSQDNKRGGSDRGFLTLIQLIGKRFGHDNATLLVDSSAGEVPRPGIDQAMLANPDTAMDAMPGITDPRDPLTLNFLFPGGHRQYIPFFLQLAECMPSATIRDVAS